MSHQKPDDENSDDIARPIIQNIVDQAASKKPPLPHSNKETENEQKLLSDPPPPIEKQKSSTNRHMIYAPDHPNQHNYEDGLSTSTTHSQSPQNIDPNNNATTKTNPQQQPNKKSLSDATFHSQMQSAMTTTNGNNKSMHKQELKNGTATDALSREQRRERLNDPNCFPKRFEVQVQARVRVGEDLSSQHLTDLPEGSVVTVEQIKDRRARISRPLCGWLSVTSKFGARIILPTNSKYSKIGGKVQFTRALQGMPLMPNNKYPTQAKIIDYNEDTNQYKVRYNNDAHQWIDLEDASVHFKSQHAPVKVQRMDGSAPTFTLQTSQAFFNQFFCKDYPQYQAQSSSTTRHMDISPIMPQNPAGGNRGQYGPYPGNMQPMQPPHNGMHPPYPPNPQHHRYPPNDPRNRHPPQHHPQYQQQQQPQRGPPGHPQYPPPQQQNMHPHGHPGHPQPNGVHQQRGPPPPRYGNAPPPGHPQHPSYGQPPRPGMDPNHPSSRPRSNEQQAKVPKDTNVDGISAKVLKGTNEEFVNKVKEIERRIIQHLHQRGYDESHPDYHRYLQKAKELAIQKAGKEREKMINAHRSKNLPPDAHQRNPRISKEEYAQYLKYRAEKERQHALAEQVRKEQLAKALAAKQAQMAKDGKLTSPHNKSSVKGLIVLRGLPGSGKTTLAKKLAQRSKNARICTEDRYHWSGKEDGVGEYKFQPQLVFLAREWCTKEIRECIQSNVNLIILDNHNARISMYEDHIQYAVEHGYRFRIIEFVATASLIDKYRNRSYKKFPREVYVKLLKLWEHDPRTELINPTFGTSNSEEKKDDADENKNDDHNTNEQVNEEKEVSTNEVDADDNKNEQAAVVNGNVYGNSPLEQGLNLNTKNDEKK